MAKCLLIVTVVASMAIACVSGPPVTDKWVSKRETAGEAELMQRVSIDVPVALHRRIKAQCALRGTKMTEEIRALLESHFPEK